MTTVSAVRTVRAPRGTALSCKGWLQEAALRMLMNNLDPEVAERPRTSSSTAAPARRRATGTRFDAIVATLRELGNDETLLVQSGKPVGVFRTHPDAPRVLIANSQPRAEVGDVGALPRARGARASSMYGQMTAGSWIYIGTQGILQGTYETFAAAARQHFGGTLDGRLVAHRAASAAWAARSRSRRR